MSVWGVKDQREFGNKYEKGKGKEGERHLSASVMNSPSTFVQELAWPLCWPMQRLPIIASGYRVCMVYDHV